MDTLSRLIQLARFQANLELRCQLGGQFAVLHDRTPKGQAPFHLALAGSCVIELPSGDTLSLQAGDFVFFPRGGAHRIVNSNRSGASGHAANAITVSTGGLLPLRRNGDSIDMDLLCGRLDYVHGRCLLLQGLPDALHVSLGDSQSVHTLQALVELMRQESEQAQPGALAIVTALSQALLTLALRAYGKTHPEQANIVALLSDPRLGASVQAMLTEPGRAWSIASLGEQATMSRATYARRFRATAGMAVADFLTRLRMAIASELLLNTRRSSGDIGMEVGYQSEAAFGKAFRSKVGHTPGRYRRLNAGLAD